MRPSAASFVIIAAGIAMLPTAVRHEPIAVAGEAACTRAAPASAPSGAAKRPPAITASPAPVPDTRVTPPAADFSSDERVSGVAHSNGRAPANTTGRSNLSGVTGQSRATAPTIPAIPSAFDANGAGTTVSRVVTHVSTVYTRSLPAGFIRTVRKTETTHEGSETITTVIITHYRRPYEPLPPSSIEIPFISLRERLLEGVSQSVMARAPGHIPGTALPGAIGNCAIAAHSNVPGCAYFRSLNRLRPGDAIFLYRGGKQYRYTVTNLHVVSPRNVSDLLPTNYRRLTLITCWLPNTQKRLIVEADAPGGAMDSGSEQVIASRRTLPVAGRTKPRHPRHSRRR
ncbi:MAG TPA: class D sortase [Armatimonadota bacterium]|nr:class D sortase [Armatimonadota bacterium]